MNKKTKKCISVIPQKHLDVEEDSSFTSPTLVNPNPEDEEKSEQIEELSKLLLQANHAYEEPNNNSDNFLVVSPDFDGTNVKEVFLPKFVMSGSKVGEKANLFLVFEANSSTYVDLLKLLSGGKMKKLKICILDENNKPQTTMLFPKPCLIAIDFGSLEKEREDEREIKVEVDFYSLEIDGFKFSF